MKLHLWILFISLFLALAAYPQVGPGKAYHPETAAGASNINSEYHTLRWVNPPNCVYNQVYLSFDSVKVANLDPATVLISGYPNIAYDSVLINQQLYHPNRYFWRVVEYGASGFTIGDIWSFSTTCEGIDLYDMDDFSFGLMKWNIQNTTTCGWQVSDVGAYTLPEPSTGKVFSADVSLCGGPINSTAYFLEVNIIHPMYFTIHFDSDWNVGTTNDSAIVEISTDGGVSWSAVWQRIGVSDRNQHFDISLNGTSSTLSIRLRTIQYGTGSWWSIDNFYYEGWTGILYHVHPLGLKVTTIYDSYKRVVLNWHQSMNTVYSKVERKTGLPQEPGAYQNLASVQGWPNMEYVDSTVNDSTTYTYRILGGTCGVYSNEATAYIYPPVPVELINFSADLLEKQVQLNWSTASETNNKGFEIERKENTSDWETIFFIPGHGTTTERKFYSYVDNSQLSSPGKLYYRLKQIDFDGSFAYSDIVEVNISLPFEYSLEQNYPNPFNPSTKIKYSVAEEALVNISVYNLLGQKAAELRSEVLQPGYYETEFDASLLSSGIYIYNMSAGGSVISKKMLYLK